MTIKTGSLDITNNDMWKDYYKLINQVYNKPPRDVPDIIEGLKFRYACRLIGIPDVSFLLLIKLCNGFYAISWLVTDPGHRNMGFASKLVEHVKTNFKGAIFAKTNSASGFYMKNGFSRISSINDADLLVYVNDINILDI